MSRRARSALGAEALRGLLGAEDLDPPAAPPEPAKRSTASAPPPKPRKSGATRRRKRRKPSKPTPPARPSPPRGADANQGAGPSESPPRILRTNAQGYIDAAVLDRARNAAYWTPGVSLSALIEQGLRAEIARLEAERGEPFPPRRGPLKPGPIVR